MGIGRAIIWLTGALVLWIAGASAAIADGVDLPIAQCIARATPDMTVRALFADEARFDCATPQAAFGSGDFWLRSAPIPATVAATPGLHVRIGGTWQAAIMLNVLYADGAIRAVGFTRATAAPHLLLGGGYALTLPARTAPPVRLLWRVRGAANYGGVLLGATLVGPARNARMEVAMAALYGLFGGAAIALIVYDLALWAALRREFLPAHAAFVLFLLGYVVASSGALGMFVPALDDTDRLRIAQVMLGGSAIMTLIFTRTFFEARIFRGALARVSEAVMAAIAVAVTLQIVSPLGWLRAIDLVLTLAYAALVVLVLPVLWRAWRLRSRYTGFFTLAWIVPVVFAGARIAGGLGRSRSPWLDHSALLAMTAEALVFSLAITYRIQLLSRERDEARKRETAARVLADTDPLTGLLNRRAFLARAIERPGEQMLLIADIDHFKAVNETIGHDGGDEVLKIVARALRAAVPPEALVARFGGEEFAIVCDAASGVVAADVLSALRAERMPFDLRVTASIGTCNGPIGREADWNALYREADRALFGAKAAGRDRARRARKVAA